MSAHVTANGLSVAFHATGTGAPLVMLHGASSSGREDFAAQVPLFSRAFRCYLPDARGHAGTRWDPAAGLRYGDLVVDLDAFADACNLGTFHLLGFSMGAATALLYAIRRPERLRTLVLVGTSPETEPRTRVIRHLADVSRIEAQDPAWAERLARRHDPVQGPGAWRRLMPAVIEMVARQFRWSGIPGSAVVVQQLTLWIGMLGGMLASRSDRLLGGEESRERAGGDHYRSSRAADEQSKGTLRGQGRKIHSS